MSWVVSPSVMYRWLPTYQTVNSLCMDTSSSPKYLDLHLVSSISRIGCLNLVAVKTNFDLELDSICDVF